MLYFAPHRFTPLFLREKNRFSARCEDDALLPEFRVPVVDFFPFNFAFNHFWFFNCVHLEMSQKKNKGREFTIDLWSDDEDFIDLGSDEESIRAELGVQHSGKTTVSVLVYGAENRVIFLEQSGQT